MKYMLTKGLLLLCVMPLLITSNKVMAQTTVTAIDKEQIKKEIQAKENEYAAVYNSGELKKIGYYAEDAIIYAQNQAAIKGREAIIEYLKVDVESSTHKISFKTNEIFASENGNLVVEIGYYQVVDSTGTAINTGNYMCLFEKKDGKYYCVREMSASDMQLR